MLKDEEKLEQDKTDEVKASSSLVSDTESADKDLVENVEILFLSKRCCLTV